MIFSGSAFTISDASYENITISIIKGFMNEYIEKDKRVRNNNINLKKRLVEAFGKDTFTEEELTRDFYTKLRISCGDIFTKEDGAFDLDSFFRIR